MRKGDKMRILTAVLLLCSATFFLSGCYSDNNNYLSPRDFVPRLEEQGIRVASVRDLPGAPFKATSGVAIMVAGSEIGVYKYDRTSKVQRH